MPRRTVDALAVDLILNNDQSGLRKLHAKVKKAMNNEFTCPDCGHEGPHDDNGLPQTSDNYACSCAGCGMHFEPLELRR